jgi:DDE_Tnp_1-associated
MDVLLLIILGTMSGYRGYRGLARFMHRHQGHLATRLGLTRAALPSYSTIRRLLNGIDFDAVGEAFNQWGQTTGLLQAGEDCAVDGKGLRNTVTDAHNAQQNFVNIVSAFQLQQGLVVLQFDPNPSCSHVHRVGAQLRDYVIPPRRTSCHYGGNRPIQQ